MRSRLGVRLGRFIAAAALATATIVPATVSAGTEPLILRLGTIESLRSLNPYQSAYFPDYETFQLNFSLLVDIGPDLEPYPAFADEWERLPDETGWEFHIRTGMKWSDGEVADSADACFSWGLVVEAIKAGESVGNGYIDPAVADARPTAVECPDAETMIVRTVDMTTKILKTSVPILPEHVWGEETYKTIGDADFKPPIVGNGQYQVVEYTPDEVVHFVKNPNWYDQQGAADEIFIQIFKNVDTMVQALKSKDIDYARGLPIDQFEELRDNPVENIETVSGKLAGWVELGFNNYGTGTGKTIQGGGPSTKALLDPLFRDALGYALDKQLLLDRVKGGLGVVGDTNVPPVIENLEADPPFAWHTTPTSLRTFNLALAIQKLEDAGYRTNDGGERLDKEGKPIKLKLVMPDSEPTYLQNAQFIESWFDELGIDVTSQVIEENSLYDIMLPPEADPSVDTYKADYDMFIWSWYETTDPNPLLSVFKCDQIGLSSDSLWCNEEYDRLYDEQNLATTDTERKRIIDEMQNLFYNEAPYHILYYDTQLDAYRTDRFGGWQNQPRDGGYPLFSYSVLNYRFLTDANAVPTPGPTTSATGGPPATSGPAPTAGPSTPTGSSGDMTLPIVIGVGVVAVVIVGWLAMRRRGPRVEEE